MARSTGGGVLSRQLPDDVTWDDVRHAPRPRRWSLLVLSAVVVGVLGVGGSAVLLRDPPRESLDERALETRSMSVEADVRSRAIRSRTFCETVKGWSATSSLRLGARTRQQCGW